MAIKTRKQQAGHQQFRHLLLRWRYYGNFWKVMTAGNYKLSPRQAPGLRQSKTQGREATSTSVPVHLDSEQEVPISTDHTEQKTWSVGCRQCYRELQTGNAFHWALPSAPHPHKRTDHVTQRRKGKNAW